MEKSHPSEIRKKNLQIPGKNACPQRLEKSKADRHPLRKNGIGADLEKSKRDRQTARKNALAAEMQKNFADRP